MYDLGGAVTFEGLQFGGCVMIPEEVYSLAEVYSLQNVYNLAEAYSFQNVEEIYDSGKSIQLAKV